MSETCGTCGRPKGDYHRRPVAGECTAPDPTDYTVSLQCTSIALRNTQAALAAARRECEGLTSSVVHLRLVGTQMATFIEEQMPLFGGASTEFDGEGEPREILERWRKADKLADKSYGPAALAAPAAGEEGETLMRALRDSATVSTRPPTSKP